MPQLTYLAKPAIAVQGMIADTAYDNIVMSRAAAGAVHVGVLVIGGPAGQLTPSPGQCQELADGAATIPVGLVGVSLYDSTRMPYTADANGKATYVATEMVPILTRGRIWVWTEAATAVTDPVAVRNLAAAADTKGQFSNAVAGALIAAPAGWKWLTSTTAAGLIMLEIR